MKWILAAAAFSLSGAGHAVSLGEGGQGDALLVPYYTALDGQSTLLAVTNPSEEPRAVRIVLAEGYNGRAVLAFNLYLAGRDRWSASISAAASGGTTLASSDKSCVYPPMSRQGLALVDDAFTGDRHDSLGHPDARLAMGQVEIFELGELHGDAALWVERGECSVLFERFVNGPWEADAQAQVAPPQGTLAADAAIIDAARGVAWDVPVIALQDFSAAARHGKPSLDAGSLRIFRPLLSAHDPDWDLSPADLAEMTRRADAVSRLIMAARLDISFELDPGLGAETRVVIALPTRPPYIDRALGGERALGSLAEPPFLDIRPLPRWPHPEVTTWRAIDPDGHARDPVDLTLSRQVNVIDLDASRTAGLHSGRLAIDLHPDVHTLRHEVDGKEEVSQGLPVVAFSLTEVRNSNAQPGLLASYAFTRRATPQVQRYIEP